MGWRRVRKFHNTKRPKVRQTWNKYNLYNLSRLTTPSTAVKTYFQQKWLAKSTTRGYHAEYVREGQWERKFTSYIPAVVPMSFKYLAESDGSREAAGRGSGVGPAPGEEKKPPKAMPYMQMVYGPMERRLDQAIFRALFASSARQARQFVTHGHVKVNGKKMIYPGYLLNPGDMFQVDPEKVMIATGATKNPAVAAGMEIGQDETEEVVAAEKDTQAAVAEEEEDDVHNEHVFAEEDQPEPEEPEDDTSASDAQKALKTSLKVLRDRTKSHIMKHKDTLKPRQKKALRAFLATLRTAITEASTATPSLVDDLEAKFQSLTNPTTSTSSPPPASPSSSHPPAESTSPALQSALKRAEENPIDPSRPYATPWRPRSYMSPFAFIPRYLEVNQIICSAVYLRHPVVRPGLAEVPTPFAAETGQLAFNWYLRRR